jgi:N-acetylmuramoyl-L-alanine amidase/type II secretory pathway predicted ATPase ExeA
MEVMPMILEFFHLREQPFGVTPDPAYLYPSRTHCEALDSLTEGILDGRGFLALIAEPGMGKTTLLNQLLEGLRDTARAAYLFQTQCDSREFFEYLLSELGVDTTGMGLVALHNKLNEMLFAEMLAGRRFVLIVDEAQNLDDSVLETIRLLSNFETSNTKLLQIILAGQPQLREKLAQKRLEQLSQRITAIKELEALSPDETAGYIRHRLKVAGHSGEILFEPESLVLIAELSRGIPRIINRICFQALMEAHAEGRQTVSPYIVVKANRKLGIQRPDHKLGVVAPAVIESANEPAAKPIVTSTPELARKKAAKFGSGNFGLFAGVLFAILLSAGVVLPQQTLSGMFQTLQNKVKASLPLMFLSGDERNVIENAKASLAGVSNRLYGREFVRESGHGLLNVRESDEKPDLLGLHSSEPNAANITGIQASSAAGVAQVIVTLDNELQFHSARISAPNRIYFDLYKAHLNPSIEQKTVPAVPGLLKWVRVAQNAEGVVRLVLDADEAKDYSAQLLSNPYRLVIDVRAQPLPDSKAGLSMDMTRTIAAPQQLGTAGGFESRVSLTRQLGLKIHRIAIDPGHGGYDTGTIGPHGLIEKELCLDVGLRLGQLLERNIPGAEVIYTRKDDTHVPLEERAEIANEGGADLFISIHANSSDIAQARGVETYYLNLAGSTESMAFVARENALAQSSVHDLPEMIKKITHGERMAESRQLAENIQTSLSQRLQLVSLNETNRGVKQAPFIVLTGANMPAVLSEISFVSNPTDESLLLESGQRQRVAEGLYRGIAVYLDNLHSLQPAKQNLFTATRPSPSSGFTTTGVAINPR